MDADLRFATTDEEKAAVYRLRYELYVEDQGLFADEADHERRWLFDEYDDKSRNILAMVDGQIVGTIRITLGAETTFSDKTRETYDFARFRGVVEERDIVVVTRLLVRHEYRGGMLALQLWWKAFEYVALNGAELMLGSCELHLVNGYWKLGFRPYGELGNHPTNGVLVPIVAVLGDLGHLRKIDSPMLGALSRRPRPSELVKHILPLVSEIPVVSESRGETEDYWAEVTQCLDDGDEGLGGILGDLTRDEAFVLLAKSHILACGAGDALILKGHVSRTLYMLLSGFLEVRDEGKTVARVEERGAVVGEVAFFSAGRRMSDVIAGPEGARVLALSDRTLREIVASHGPVAAKFLHFVACGLSQKLEERARGNARAEAAGGTIGAQVHPRVMAAPVPSTSPPT